MLKAEVGDFKDFTRNKMSGSTSLMKFYIEEIVIYNLYGNYLV